MKKQVRYKQIPDTLKSAVLKIFNQGGDNRDKIIASKLGVSTILVHKVVEYELKACKSRMRETRLDKNRKL